MKKILTIPNLLSFLRILLLPVLWFFFHRVNQWIFLGLFLLIGLTDVLDGYLARKLNCVTRFGKILDSTADLPFYLLILYFSYHLYQQAIMQVWGPILVLTAVRLVHMLITLLLSGHLMSFHTLFNKITGVAVFVVFVSGFFIPVQYLLWALLFFGFFSAFEDMALFYFFRNHDLDTLSIFPLLWKKLKSRKS